MLPKAEDKDVGGIIVPSIAKEQGKTQEGHVIALGGEWDEPAVKVGSRVLISRYSGTELKIDGHRCVMCDIENVAAVFE